MLKSKDFKARALENLRGKWGRVYLIVLIVALISTVFSIASAIYLQSTGITYDPQDFDSIIIYLTSEEYRTASSIGNIGTVISLFFSISLAWTYLEVTANRKPEMSEFVGTFKRAGESFVVSIVMGIKIFLWALLFIIPGIIKAFAYSMSFYVKTENPQLSSFEAIDESQRLMNGNKMRLFCLELSFIGWYLLVGIGTGLLEIFFKGPLAFINLIISTALTTIVTVYVGCAVACFYKELVSPKESLENNAEGFNA